MGGAAVTAVEKIDVSDVQGLVVAGYGQLKAACFVMLSLNDGAPSSNGAARAWLQRLAGEVTTSGERPAERALNVAFTHHGLLALGLPADVAGAFSNEFIGGMAVPHRSRILGDVGDSAPEHWQWGGPTTPAVDVLLMLYARDEAGLEAMYGQHRAEF